MITFKIPHIIDIIFRLTYNYTIKKRDCKQSDGDSGDYVLVKDKGDSEE